MENPTAATSQINQSAQNIQQTLNSVGINSSILGQSQKWFYLSPKNEGKIVLKSFLGSIYSIF